jgi:hypothetical protein
VNSLLPIILREILIFGSSLALVPLLIKYGRPYFDIRPLLAGEILSGGIHALWVFVLFPYIIIQTIRAFLWSERSLVGRKWASLYFVVVLTGLASWGFFRAWDQFYYMWVLGDMPGEIVQFLELQYVGVLVFVICALLAARCARIFLDPEKYAPEKLKDAKN